ncbi:MAG TPA: phosphatase PAP2 family protein, partial [Pseudonocardiaceae bacterium]
IVVFLVLTALVAGHWAPLLTLDTNVDAAVHQFALSHGWVRPVALVVTDLGSPVAVDVVAAVAAIALLVARHWPAAVAVVVARFGELAVETAVKALVDRGRPVFSQPLATAGGASFPSGHTAGSAALYGILILMCAPVLTRGWRLLVVVAGTVFVLAVGASRVVLGVHYLSDVVAGLALGLVWAAGTLTLVAVVVARTGPRAFFKP